MNWRSTRISERMLLLLVINSLSLAALQFVPLKNLVICDESQPHAFQWGLGSEGRVLSFGQMLHQVRTEKQTNKTIMLPVGPQTTSECMACITYPREECCTTLNCSCQPTYYEEIPWSSVTLGNGLQKVWLCPVVPDLKQMRTVYQTAAINIELVEDTNTESIVVRSSSPGLTVVTFVGPHTRQSLDVFSIATMPAYLICSSRISLSLSAVSSYGSSTGGFTCSRSYTVPCKQNSYWVVPQDPRWTCLPSWEKALIVMALIYVIILCVFILSWLGFLLIPVKWTFKWVADASKWVYRLPRTPVAETITAVITGTWGKLVVWFTPRPALLLPALFTLSMASPVCDWAAIIPAPQQETCQFDGFVETCRFTFTTQITLPYLRSYACLTLQDPQGNPAGTLQIQYMELIAKPRTRLSYYTSAWELFPDDSRRCKSEARCKPSECASVNPDDPTADGHLTAAPINYSGVSGCISSCGCETCGCFYCDPSCYYFRMAYRPIPPYIQVFDTDAPNWVVRLNVSQYNTKDEITATSIIETSNMAESVSPSLRTTLTSTIGVEVPELSKYNLILMSQDGSYWPRAAVTAPRNSPTANMIGDIQTNNLSYLTSPSTKVAFAPSMSSVIAHGENLQYTAIDCGASRTSSLLKYPLQSQKAILSAGADVMVISATSSYPLTIAVTTPFPITSKLRVDVVCPKAVTYQPATGCWGCVEGASAKVTLQTDCAPGLALLSSADVACTLQTTTLTLYQAPTEYTIHFLATQKKIDCLVIISAGDKTAQIHLTGTLNDPPSIDPSNHTTNTTSSHEDGFFDGMKNIFHLTSGVWGDIESILVLIALLLAALLTIWVILKVLILLATSLTKKHKKAD